MVSPGKRCGGTVLLDSHQFDHHDRCVMERQRRVRNKYLEREWMSARGTGTESKVGSDAFGRGE
jgi:hypothetical protein